MENPMEGFKEISHYLWKIENHPIWKIGDWFVSVSDLHYFYYQLDHVSEDAEYAYWRLDHVSPKTRYPVIPREIRHI